MRIQFRTGDALGREIEERSLILSPSKTAKEICARYFDLCRRSMPWLSQEQWRLMMLLGPPSWEESVADWKQRMLSTMKEIDQPHDIQMRVTPEFIDRFNAFTFPETVAIADRVLKLLTTVKQ